MKTIVNCEVWMTMLIRAAALVAVIVLSACASSGAAGPQGGASEPGGADGSGTGPLEIVVTTTILGEMTQRIAGEDGDVEILIPVGTDPHHYEASAREADLLRKADLVVANGLNLEAGLESALAAAEADGANVVRVGPLVDPIPLDAEGGGDHDDGGGDHDDGLAAGSLDPHFWLDPARMADAATVIGDALADASPAAAPQIRARATETAEDLASLTEDLGAQLAAVPPARRVLLTNHDALSYLAERFDFRILGTIVPSGTTLAEPSSRQLAELAEEIVEHDLPAIFAETTLPTRLSDALAAEVGRGVEVVELYTGSLGGPGSGAETYEDMMRLNVERIVEALA